MNWVGEIPYNEIMGEIPCNEIISQKNLPILKKLFMKIVE